jgi:hypothetical protein
VRSRRGPLNTSVQQRGAFSSGDGRHAARRRLTACLCRGGDGLEQLSSVASPRTLRRGGGGASEWNWSSQTLWRGAGGGSGGGGGVASEWSWSCCCSHTQPAGRAGARTHIQRGSRTHIQRERQ